MTCPEPPDTTPDCDPSDEIDVDMTDLELPDDAEYLGSYASIAAYLRAMLEPEVTRACAWILEHLDYEAVRRRWESDGSRLRFARGQVYRVAASASAGDPSRE
jgi:hypothetical protein